MKEEISLMIKLHNYSREKLSNPSKGGSQPLPSAPPPTLFNFNVFKMCPRPSGGLLSLHAGYIPVCDPNIILPNLKQAPKYIFQKYVHGPLLVKRKLSKSLPVIFCSSNSLINVVLTSPILNSLQV